MTWGMILDHFKSMQWVSQLQVIVWLELGNLLPDCSLPLVLNYCFLCICSETQHYWYYEQCQWLRRASTVS